MHDALRRARSTAAALLVAGAVACGGQGDEEGAGAGTVQTESGPDSPYLFVWTTDSDSVDLNFLAVLDADPASAGEPAAAAIDWGPRNALPPGGSATRRTRVWSARRRLPRRAARRPIQDAGRNPNLQGQTQTKPPTKQNKTKALTPR